MLSDQSKNQGKINLDIVFYSQEIDSLKNVLCLSVITVIYDT